MMAKFSADAMARPPEMTMRAAVSSGRSDFTISAPRKVDRPGSSAGGAASIGALPPSAGDRVEGRGADGDHLLRVGRLHRRHRVAGVDRAHEGVGIDHAGDVGQDLHVEQGGDARHHVLAGGRGRRQQVRIARRHRHQQCGERFGEAVRHGTALGGQHLGHAGDLRRGGCRRAGAFADQQHMDLAQLVPRPRRRCAWAG